MLEMSKPLASASRVSHKPRVNASSGQILVAKYSATYNSGWSYGTLESLELEFRILNCGIESDSENQDYECQLFARIVVPFYNFRSF